MLLNKKNTNILFFLLYHQRQHTFSRLQNTNSFLSPSFLPLVLARQAVEAFLPPILTQLQACDFLKLKMHKKQRLEFMQYLKLLMI